MNKLINKILLYSLGLIIGGICLELFYQVAEIELPYHRLSPDIGKKMIPSKRITYFKDGFYLGRTNKYGYLGKTYSPEKPDDRIRIALIGDSYVEGFHVFEQYHFSQILENKLNEGCKKQKYEVLNFGVGDYNFNDMIIYYKNYIHIFNPDILIFVLKSNDFYNRTTFFPAPKLALRNDSLLIDYSYTQSKLFKTYDRYSILVENMCSIKSFLNAYKLIKKGRVKKIIFDKFYKEDSEEEQQKKKDIIVSVQQIDKKIIRSLDWIEEVETYFVFEDYSSKAMFSQLEREHIHVSSIYPYLVYELEDKGVKYNYWDVTDRVGHWNHKAQPVVAEYLKNLILETDETFQE